MRGVHVAIPATVVEFDSKKQTAKVSIDILEQIGEQNSSIANLEDVPFAFPRSGGFVITFPVNVGDKVQLLFQHRSIDKWAIDGTKDQKDLRTHNINDSIASNLVAYPLNDLINDFAVDGLVLRTLDNSNYIKLTQNGIFIKGNVKIEGELEVTGIIKSLKDVVANIISLLKHIHSGVKAGSSTTTPPQ